MMRFYRMEGAAWAASSCFWSAEACSGGRVIGEEGDGRNRNLYHLFSISGLLNLVFSCGAALSGRVAITDSASAFRLALPKNPGVPLSSYFKEVVLVNAREKEPRRLCA